MLKMIFDNSALFGVATGTGLALLFAVTIVIYKYNLDRRKGREWAELDRWEETKKLRKIKYKVSTFFFFLNYFKNIQ